MCSSEAISCEFKLCSNLPTFQYARADHLFSQPSSPRFRLNLSSSCRRADRYHQSFRSIPLFKMMVQDFEFLAFWCPSFVCFLVDLVDISCFLWRVPFPVVLVDISFSCGSGVYFWWLFSGVCFLGVLVEVKVVNMEVKPLCLVHNGRFVDNGLQAHRVTHKKWQREGNVQIRIRNVEQISKYKIQSKYQI